MANADGRMRNRIGELHLVLDRFLYALSAWALPIGIGLLSLVALFSWDTYYPADSGQALNIRVVRQTATLNEPAQAIAALTDVSPVPAVDTRLSESPFWFSFLAPAVTAETPMSVEFPSRHALGISCWNGTTLTPLGTADRLGKQQGIATVKTGFALDLAPSPNPVTVLCLTQSIGPAHITAQLWRETDLQTSDQQLHRRSGLLDGGIVVLALFVLVTALVNRNSLYVLFAAWLVANLRMAALSAGWDFQWLGHTVPPDWLFRSRSLAAGVYYVLSITLFKALFNEPLARVGSLALFRFAQWSCLPVLLLSALLSYRHFLPVLWIMTAISVGVMVYFLVRILKISRSRVAIWFGLSVGIALFASLSEVLAAAMGLRELIGSVNSVTAALASSLMAALAIAEQMRQEHEHRLSAQAELAHTFAAMPIGLFSLNLRGRFTSANPALRAMLSPNVLIRGSNSWQQYFMPDAWPQLRNMLTSGTSDELELQGKSILGVKGSKRFLVKATLANDKIEGSLQDITEKFRATEELYFLANHDSLTKVLNRHGIEQALTQGLAKLATGNSLTMAYLDLDRFKLINDLFGHGAGDEVLRQVCKRVTGLLPPEARFGRVGGDEFVIVIPGTPIANASLLCRGMLDFIGEESYRVGEKAFFVHGSMGLIEVGAGMQFNEAMSSADRACRQAKSASGGGLVVYERGASAFDEHEAEIKLIALLSADSAADGLYLVMQPIMSLTAPHESLNFEVLLRMMDPQGNAVRTDLLIAAAENSGRMGMIDRWVLTTTLIWLKTHREQLQHTKFVCVNLSGASLNDEQFLQDVFALLEQNRAVVGQLCLEITESVALHDRENTRRFVEKVRGLGARVALDDFGAGYTSFSYLKEFKTDMLKIDGSFIVNMNQHPANVSIVEAIVSLAKNLGMKVVAEWAEDAATVQTLVEIGVDYVQGYVVARPQDPAKLLQAASAASFIQDEELAQIVELIGARESTPTPMRRSTDFPDSKIH